MQSLKSLSMKSFLRFLLAWQDINNDDKKKKLHKTQQIELFSKCGLWSIFILVCACLKLRFLGSYQDVVN